MLFVLATAISGPTRMKTVASATRVACEPGVLQIVTCGQPARRASSIAASVSTVSPDCATEITSVRSSRTGLAVAELGRVVDLGRDAREALDVVPPDHRRVHRGAHADQHHALDARTCSRGSNGSSASSTRGGSMR